MPATATTLAKIENKVDKDTAILYRAKSMFPFELFPTEVIVYTTKIDIIDSVFFWSKDVMTIPIQEVFGIEVQTTPFFATLLIRSRQPMTPLMTIKFLKTSDALELREIIQGLVIAFTNKLDLTPLSAPQIKEQAKDLGDAPVSS